MIIIVDLMKIFGMKWMHFGMKQLNELLMITRKKVSKIIVRGHS